MTIAELDITRLLLRWSEGDTAALEELIPLIYPELRRIARHYMHRENAAHTLQTSALVNEAYLRLVDHRCVEWRDRAHFFAVVAQVMRHILVDHARKRLSQKRGADATRLTLNENTIVVEERAAELLSLDSALAELAKFDERKSRIVELRFFGGLTVEETADLLNLSPITIKREWRVARAWLAQVISPRLEILG